MDTLFLISICFILVFLLWLTYYGYQKLKKTQQELQKIKFDISAVHTTIEKILGDVHDMRARLMVFRPTPPMTPSVNHLLQSGAAVLPDGFKEVENDDDDDEDYLLEALEEDDDEFEDESENESESENENENENESENENENESESENENENESESENENENQEESVKEEEEKTEEVKEEEVKEEEEATKEETQEDEEVVVREVEVSAPKTTRGRPRRGGSRQTIREIQSRIESKI